MALSVALLTSDQESCMHCLLWHMLHMLPMLTHLRSTMHTYTSCHPHVDR
jgi:hypothetical protein